MSIQFPTEELNRFLLKSKKMQLQFLISAETFRGTEHMLGTENKLFACEVFSRFDYKPMFENGTHATTLHGGHDFTQLSTTE